MRRFKVVLTEVVPDSRCKVIDSDTGEEIEHLRGITIKAAVNEPTVVTLELVGVEVEGDITTMHDAYVVHRTRPSMD
jgi:hypothetical protein